MYIEILDSYTFIDTNIRGMEKFRRDSAVVERKNGGEIKIEIFHDGKWKSFVYIPLEVYECKGTLFIMTTCGIITLYNDSIGFSGDTHFYVCGDDDMPEVLFDRSEDAHRFMDRFSELNYDCSVESRR